MKTITDEQRLNLLTSALEGGSNYWYEISNAACKKIDSVKPSDGKTPFVDRLWAAIQAGKNIEVHDIESRDLLGHISLDTIKQGEVTMLKQQPQHFADILSENDDAVTGDVWFQYCIMNKLIYG